ncbi:DNA translocase SpoIIIE [Weizmannia acidilactici]|uniref:DNA translocase SpoIIIE n=1 Tax=Weizmannia acidilactici TaxID=2607726 RepID=A0A5J4JEJ8_9BACI|nr:DNA translocase FtsK [Weizmannia acidilactici]GER65683.1 DNA translocase SpoIIIE [Weizmannia acidilactici]GER68987.1 DNA translocase SpoIIIE [Weizmannia acidilactici]GER72040.1 DNA translocase SpoIIIE [Weizmannia acidilactici]
MAKKKRRRRKKAAEQIKIDLKFELIGLIIFVLGIFTLYDIGKTGTTFILLFRFFFGQLYWIAVCGLMVLSGYLMIKREWPKFFCVRITGFYLLFAGTLLYFHVRLIEALANAHELSGNSVIMNTLGIWHKDEQVWWQIVLGRDVHGNLFGTRLGGGMTGAVLYAASHFLFDALGTKILCVVLVMIAFMFLTGKPLSPLLEKSLENLYAFFRKQWAQSKEEFSNWKDGKRKKKEKKRQKEQAQQSGSVPSKIQEGGNGQQAAVIEETPPPIISSFTEQYEGETGQPDQQVHEAPIEETDEDHSPPIKFTEYENEDYQLPPITLLKRPRAADQSSEYKAIHANAAKLERTFQSFGVKARVTQVHLGPAVTKYEVHPDVGVKVSKIVSLSDDIALALAAKDIRMEAPIPGKSAIGIEVPNREVAVVSLREVLEGKENNPALKLQIALGRDITGQAVLAELNKMPHLLVAGATGSGKSVCINGIITSILMRAKPHEVKLMMIDPKMVELNVYNGVPHLLAPVVTNPKRASQALKKVVNEMERRYELFSHTGTRNIEGYNDHMKKINIETGDKQPLLPYIVVIIDELADLMMVASGDVEDSITRLSQMARAAGIHLIIATQRPSVDVITGVIKANIPSRIAFAVSSATDSRTILDMGGAEKLLGRGDMLFLPVGASKPIRVQGAFLSDEEVEEVVDFVISQQKAQYQEEMIPEENQDQPDDFEDELYDDAVLLISEMQTASVSMLQRRFRIGYTRAARLIDAMEARGVVGPYEGSKPRAVLIPKPSEEQSS